VTITLSQGHLRFACSY